MFRTCFSAVSCHDEKLPWKGGCSCTITGTNGTKVLVVEMKLSLIDPWFPHPGHPRQPSAGHPLEEGWEKESVCQELEKKNPFLI